MTRSRLRALLPWPIILMVGLFVITLIIWAIVREWPIGKDLDGEVVKALPSAGIVTVAGALLTYLTSEADRRRSDLGARQKVLTETLNRITSSYNSSKRARRNARALGLLSAGERMTVDAYDKCMADVNDAQLELESIGDDVRGNTRDFPSGAEIAKHLDAMERYLGKMVSEYEEKRPTLAGQKDFALAPITESALSDFLATAKKSKFKENYSSHQRDIREAIGYDILNMASGRKKPPKKEKADAGSTPA